MLNGYRILSINTRQDILPAEKYDAILNRFFNKEVDVFKLDYVIPEGETEVIAEEVIGKLNDAFKDHDVVQLNLLARPKKLDNPTVNLEYMREAAVRVRVYNRLSRLAIIGKNSENKNSSFVVQQEPNGKTLIFIGSLPICAVFYSDAYVLLPRITSMHEHSFYRSIVKEGWVYVDRNRHQETKHYPV